MFAQAMVTDHAKAMASLDSLVQSFSITLPTMIDSMDAAVNAQLVVLPG